jgi:hypothetical protein
MPTTEQIATPELDRLSAASEEIHAIGQFLEWLGSGEAKPDGTVQGVFLGYYPRLCDVYPNGGYGPHERSENLWPLTFGTEELLSRYLNIDMRKVDRERRQILESQRQSNVTNQRCVK